MIGPPGMEQVGQMSYQSSRLRSSRAPTDRTHQIQTAFYQPPSCPWEPSRPTWNPVSDAVRSSIHTRQQRIWMGRGQTIDLESRNRGSNRFDWPADWAALGPMALTALARPSLDAHQKGLFSSSCFALLLLVCFGLDETMLWSYYSAQAEHSPWSRGVGLRAAGDGQRCRPHDNRCFCAAFFVPSSLYRLPFVLYMAVRHLRCQTWVPDGAAVACN